MPTDQINYMRNSVKATVDAYDGTVRLYAWDDQDPMLKAWSSAFPGTVQAEVGHPRGAVSHLRYPEDMFKVQRYQFARYHVTDPSAFSRTTPAGRSRRTRTAPRACSRRTGCSSTSRRPADRDRTSLRADLDLVDDVDVRADKSNLAAFVSVDSDATSPTYGQIQVLDAARREHAGPGQHRQRDAVGPRRHRGPAPLKQGGAPGTYGNLLTLPVTGGLMYVQPIYAAASASDASYPILRYVTGLLRRQGRHRHHPRPRRSTTSSAATPRRRPPTAARTTRRPTTPATSRPGSRTCSTRPTDFQTADEAFAAGKVGQWATLVEEALAAKVDEAIQDPQRATPARDRRRDRRAGRRRRRRRGDARRVEPTLDLGRPCAVR